MNSYFTYYLGWILLSYALRSPWLLVGLVVLFVLHRFIPGPGPLFRLFGRAGRLRAQVEVNRANVTARRDLASIYLDGLRARSAIRLLEEGLALSPNDAELLYLLGLALHRGGRHEDALTPLVRAVEIDPRIRYGLPYSVAGDALAALGRWEAALDAYERYLLGNSSDVSVYTRLARAQLKTGDAAAARKTLLEGLHTWSVLPRSMKRRQFRHYLAGQWARVTVLKQPLAILVVLVMSGACAVTAWGLYAPVVRLFKEPWSWPAGYVDRAVYDGIRRCGSQSTGDFAGKYVLADSQPGTAGSAAIVASAGAGVGPVEAEVESYLRALYANFEIRNDRIVSGTYYTQEFCLTKVLERSPTVLVSEAVWYEQVADPDDAFMVTLQLSREGDRLILSFLAFNQYEPGDPWRITFTRQ